MTFRNDNPVIPENLDAMKLERMFNFSLLLVMLFSASGFLGMG